MLEFVSNLPPLGKVTLFYLMFLAVLLAYFWFEIKRSPIYLDEDMRQRIDEQ